MTATGGPSAQINQPKQPIDVLKTIRKFNAYSNGWVTVGENNKKEFLPSFGVPIAEEGANIEERIAQLFSDAYRTYNTAFLGFQSYDTPEELEHDDSLTDEQKVNSQFMVRLGNQGSEQMIDVLKFHHRPLFCGVNVLYEPTVTTDFAAMHHTVDYFNGSWNTAWENPKYNGTAGKDSVDCRDLCFNPTFLSDMQGMANDEPELEMVFVRKGFSVGVGSVSVDNLKNEDAIGSAMFGRVFENDWEESIVPFAPVIMKTEVFRTIPVVSNDKKSIVSTPEQVVYNNLCYFASPYIEDNDSRKSTPAEVTSIALTNPSIVYVGEEIKGYKLASYINIPVCSWTYFKSTSSGFGSGNDSNQTKVVQRLQNTQQCGPFMRVKAKDYYAAEVMEVLLGFSTIKVSINESDEAEQAIFAPVKAENQVIWTPPKGDLSENIKAIAKELWRMRDEVSPSLRFKKYETEDSADRNELYKIAYVRGGSENSASVNALFEEVELPNRFAFFICQSNRVVCIAQFPCIPLRYAEPLDDDYVTQLVPLYRKIDDESSTEGGSSTQTTWYINDADVLVNRGTDGSRKFYKVNKQKPSVVTYPSDPSNIAAVQLNGPHGFIYTCNGILYRGPAYEKAGKGKKCEPGMYYIGNNHYVEGKPNLEYNEETQWWKKATHTPENIQGITLETPAGDYVSGPMGIASYNYLDFMDHSGENSNAKTSRTAYKEFIKQGCVFMDGMTASTRKKPVAEPSKNPSEFVPNECGFVYVGKEIRAIEPEAKGELPEEPKENKDWLKTVKIVVVAVLALICVVALVFLTFRVVKMFKGGSGDFKCP